MKRIFIIIGFLILIIIIVFVFFKKKEKGVKLPSLTNQIILTTPPVSYASEFQYKDRLYSYRYFTVSRQEKLSLIANFSEKITSTEIVSINGCRIGINGGFYDTDNTPLGGFMTNKTVFKKNVKNRLIDGFLWKEDNHYAITLSDPPQKSQFYLQTGPLLMVNGRVTAISIYNDEYSRRSVAGLTKDKDLLFLTVYNPESVYEGPLLADLPSIIFMLNQEASFHLTEAINLDGGSASAFISKEKTLQEFSPIGSFFCVQ